MNLIEQVRGALLSATECGTWLNKAELMAMTVQEEDCITRYLYRIGIDARYELKSRWRPPGKYPNRKREYQLRERLRD